MTYPPQQQPYGGQDPYGQYGYGSTAQFGGGYPPPPPPKKNTGAIVAVIAVVVLVAGLGITGFVAPGFFLADDKQTTTEPSTPPKTTKSSEEPGGGAEPEDTLKAVADGLESHDGDALGDLACADAESGVKSAIDDVDAVDEARLKDTEKNGDDEVIGLVEVTVGSESGDFEVTVLDDGGWCWQDITGSVGDEDPDEPTASSKPVEPTGGPTGTPSASGKPVDGAALNYAKTFLDAVNGGDAETAKSMLCADGIKKASDVDDLLAADPKNLAVNPEVEGNSASPESYQLYLSGSVDGREMEGHSGNLWIVAYTGSWCVHAFRAI